VSIRIQWLKTCDNLWIVRQNWFVITATIGSAVCLAVIPLVGCNKNLVIVLFIFAMIAFGMQAGGDIPIIAGIELNSCFNF
jgi:hypothetical protein